MFIDNGFDLLNVLETEQPECKQYKRTGRLTAGNIKMLGVPAEVHAKAKELAQRYDLRVYEVVAQALDLYDRLRAPRNNGDTEPQE